MIRPGWASNPDSPITVATDTVINSDAISSDATDSATNAGRATGNLALPNSRREFPRILRKLRSVIFFLLFLHYLSSFITIYNKH